MGERKVLNKYFPPDFDPMKLPQRSMDFSKPMGIRMMLPFSLCCLSCGHYMYQGKKFNSKKTTAKGMDYLGIKRYRFEIKCEICNNRMTFLTDPKNQDYECETGATRNYSAWQEARREELDKTREQEEKEALGQEDEKKDSMQVLESRTLESKREMDDLDALEKMRNQNKQRARVNPTKVVEMNEEKIKEMERKHEEQMLAEFKVKKHLHSSKILDKDVTQQVSKEPKVSTSEHSDEEVISIIKRKHKKRSMKSSSSAPLKKSKASGKSAKVQKSAALGLLSAYSSSSDGD